MIASNINKMHDKNSKKILCINVLNKKKCNYGNKCLYAHHINEQNIEPIRHKVYTIIKGTNNLQNINLIDDVKLYETMELLTKICNQCVKNLCPGGYNCRNGAINNNFRICKDDLMYGQCLKNGCQLIHLTKRKLVPYTKQKHNKESLTCHNLLINYLKKNQSDMDSSDSDDDDTEEVIRYLNSDSDDESIFLV